MIVESIGFLVEMFCRALSRCIALTCVSAFHQVSMKERHSRFGDEEYEIGSQRMFVEPTY